MTPQQARNLLKRYRLGLCTPEEERRLLEWVKTREETEFHWTASEKEAFLQAQADAIYSHTGVRVSEEAPSYNIHRWRSARWWAAASVLIILSAGIYYFMKNSPTDTAIVPSSAGGGEAITPGGNKATLTLSDGSIISLGEGDTEKLASQGGLQIIQLDSGLLSYKNAGPESFSYNTLATPRGGQYQVLLPDGSHVWLNSASSLRFPTYFAGKTREVELSGEAYFEVKEKKSQPFIVKVRDISVNVLGTGFNVMAYEDEETISTTLVHGAVKVISPKSSARIQPGEQANIYPGQDEFSLRKPNLNEVLAWREGGFLFEGEKITSIMRQLSRWYDVEIIYKGDIPRTEFSGSMDRKASPLEILEAIELTGDVHFIVTNKTITVVNGPKQ